MEDKDLIGKEFDFFRYQSVAHLSWYDELERYIGSRCEVLDVPDILGRFVRAQVYPTIGKKFEKHFPKEAVIEQIEKKERENMSIEDILSEVKQLTSQI